MKIAASPDELVEMLRGCYWSLAEAPSIKIVPHPDNDWDFVVASNRVSDLYYCETAANYLRTRYTLRQA